MTMEEYIAEIRLALTGNVLELEIDDKTLEQIVNKSLREVQRYIDSTKVITVPFASCIDLTDFNVSSVSRVYRVQGVGDIGYAGGQQIDPFYAQVWFAFSNGGNMYNLNNFVSNFGAWNTMLQIRNTVTTDLTFREDKQQNKLYINVTDKPTLITIEYVPKFLTVEDIKSDYWIDIIVRLSTALTKETLGRIRSRYTSSNSLWQQDGERLLEEAREDLATLRETLRVNSQLTYVYD